MEAIGRGCSMYKTCQKIIKALEAEKEPTMYKVVAVVFNVQTTIRKFVNNPTNCGHGIMFARELNIEARSPDKGTYRPQRQMANYLSSKFRGDHLDQYDKLETTTQEI